MGGAAALGLALMGSSGTTGFSLTAGPASIFDFGPRFTSPRAASRILAVLGAAPTASTGSDFAGALAAAEGLAAGFSAGGLGFASPAGAAAAFFSPRAIARMSATLAPPPPGAAFGLAGAGL